MNRYPWWKYALLAVALLVGLLYTVPNFYGEAPAVQVSSGKATVKVDAAMVQRVQQALAAAGLQPDFVQFEGNSVRARFADTDTQLKAKDAISAALNPDPADPRFIVALNLVSRSPQWMASVRALPMYLGLDLRGGVHFLMEVDMKSALTKRAEALTGDVRSLLREKNIRHAGIVREGNTVDVRFRDEATAQQARGLLADQLPDLDWQLAADGSGGVVLAGALKPEAAKNWPISMSAPSSRPRTAAAPGVTRRRHASSRPMGSTKATSTPSCSSVRARPRSCSTSQPLQSDESNLSASSCRDSSRS